MTWTHPRGSSWLGKSFLPNVHLHTTPTWHNTPSPTPKEDWPLMTRIRVSERLYIEPAPSYYFFFFCHLKHPHPIKDFLIGLLIRVISAYVTNPKISVAHSYKTFFLPHTMWGKDAGPDADVPVHWWYYIQGINNPCSFHLWLLPCWGSTIH